LMKRQELHDAVVDFELQLVDGVFFIENALRQQFVRFEHGVDGLMDGAFAETAHPEQAFFQLVQIFFEVAFHELFPFSLSNPLGHRTAFLRERISQSGR
jgi:hypothetical protein